MLKVLTLVWNTLFKILAPFATLFGVVAGLKEFGIVDLAALLKASPVGVQSDSLSGGSAWLSLIDVLGSLLEKQYLVYSSILFLVLVLVLWVLSFLIGGVAGRVSISRVLRYFNVAVLLKTLIGIHRFEHIRLGALNCDREEFRHELKKCLEAMSVIVSHFVGAPVSVNIKIFDRRKTTHPTAALKFTNVLLKTLERWPSPQEQSNLSPRVNLETYRIVKGDGGRAVNLHHRKNGSKELIQCSAFNHVFGDCGHFWVNNDLKKAVKKKNYFNESKGYEKYYQSSGVFIISTPLEEGTSVPMNQEISGVLIVDSLSVKRFDRWIFPILIGYFAHRFYEILFNSSFESVHDSCPT